MIDYFCQVKKDVNIVADGINEFPSSFTIDLWRFLWKFRTVQFFGVIDILFLFVL